MTIRFAFYGRVSTEDHQDPEASRQWQLRRARSLIEQRGGEIVMEFFDTDKSRSIPWSRRPYAAALLDEIKDGNRQFDAVVIGEPQRAFYGNQYSLTFPLFEHFRVQLWVPEVGGPIDGANEAHDMIMGVFGGLSKGERNRIKIRVRAAMAAIVATEGRWMGGRPPYGYILEDCGPHPNPSKAADGKRLKRMVAHPVYSLVVQWIFAEYLRGRGFLDLAHDLTGQGILCPSASDPDRNKHRTKIEWTKSAIRTILGNPRYTGRQVWGRQRKDEVLLDVEDVALGYVSKFRWNGEEEWIWSEEDAHEGLVSMETFQAARQSRIKRSSGVYTKKSGRPAAHPYVFRGCIDCGFCDRKMQGTWNNHEAYYRCCLRAQPTMLPGREHPRTVYLREAEIAHHVESWVATCFSPARIESTIEALIGSQDPEPEDPTLTIRKLIAACDRKLHRYRAALDAGADPVEVTTWINETKHERAALETQLRAPVVRPPKTLGNREIAEILQHAGDLAAVIQRAHPDEKSDLYKRLGLQMTYYPQKRLVEARVIPAGPPHVRSVCVRGGT